MGGGQVVVKRPACPLKKKNKMRRRHPTYTTYFEPRARAWRQSLRSGRRTPPSYEIQEVVAGSGVDVRCLIEHRR